MRTMLITAAALALVAGVAFAHGHAGIGEHFSQADSNSDGTVTRAEFDQARAAMFARLDADSDGQLERGEHRRMGRGRHGEHGMQRGHGEHARMADSNNDGAVTRDEFLARPLEMFARLDANSDGVISAEERDAARGRHAEWRHARHERGERLRAADADRDRQLSREEFASMGDQMFTMLDADHNGAVSRQEAEARHGGRR